MRMAIAEVEARCFEHQTLETDNIARLMLEKLFISAPAEKH